MSIFEPNLHDLIKRRNRIGGLHQLYRLGLWLWLATIEHLVRTCPRELVLGYA